MGILDLFTDIISGNQNVKAQNAAAQASANAANNDINLNSLLQLYSLISQNQSQNLALSPTQNADGSGNYYDPEKGFISYNNENQDLIQQLNEKDAIRKLTQNSLIDNERTKDSEKYRNQDNRLADEALAQFQNEQIKGGLSDKDLADLLFAQESRRNQDSADRISTNIMRQFLRSGESVAPLLASMASQQAEDRNANALDSLLSTIGLGDKIKNEKTSNLLDRYYNASSRATSGNQYSLPTIQTSGNGNGSQQQLATNSNINTRDNRAQLAGYDRAVADQATQRQIENNKRKESYANFFSGASGFTTPKNADGSGGDPISRSDKFFSYFGL